MAERERVVSFDDDGREEFNAQKGTAAARRRPRRDEGRRGYAAVREGLAGTVRRWPDLG